MEKLQHDFLSYPAAAAAALQLHRGGEGKKVFLQFHLVASLPPSFPGFLPPLSFPLGSLRSKYQTREEGRRRRTRRGGGRGGGGGHGCVRISQDRWLRRRRRPQEGERWKKDGIFVLGGGGRTATPPVAHHMGKKRKCFFRVAYTYVLSLCSGPSP